MNRNLLIPLCMLPLLVNANEINTPDVEIIAVEEAVGNIDIQAETVCKMPELDIIEELEVAIAEATKEASFGPEMEITEAFATQLEHTHSAKSGNDYCFHVGVDFLFWKAKQEGLAYAVSDTGSSATPHVTHGKVHEVNTKWQPGLRIALGVIPKNNDWSTNLVWTYQQSSQSNRLHPRNGGSVASTLTPIPLEEAIANATIADNAGKVDRAFANWNLSMHIIDLELGKPIVINQTQSAFHIHPHLGIRFVHTNQGLRANYQRAAKNNIDTISEQTHFRHDTNGIGLRAGVHTHFAYEHNWSLYANADLSVIYSWYDLENSSTLTSTDAAFTPISSRIGYDTEMMKLIAGVQAGFEYAWKFKNNCSMAARLGWEHHILVDHNQMMRFTADEEFGGVFSHTDGELAFIGLRAGLHFQF